VRLHPVAMAGDESYVGPERGWFSKPVAYSWLTSSASRLTQLRTRRVSASGPARSRIQFQPWSWAKSRPGSAKGLAAGFAVFTVRELTRVKDAVIALNSVKFVFVEVVQTIPGSAS
jgi:hypothetical protein